MNKLLAFVIAVCLGWPLTFAPLLITEPLGIMHGWGYAHLGLPLLLYPLTEWLVYVGLLRLSTEKEDRNEDEG